jgi:hypothetical protein
MVPVRIGSSFDFAKARSYEAALEFISASDKNFKQVMNKLLSSIITPVPTDSSALKSFENLRRTDFGE